MAQELSECPCQGLQSHPQTVHLRAAVHAVYAPLGEVLTVVAEDAIPVFPQARTCSSHDLFAVPAVWPRLSHPYRMTLGEARERNLLYRSPSPVKDKTAVVHDSPVPDIHAMVRIAQTRCDEVRAQCRFRIRRQQAVTSGQRCLVGSQSHLHTASACRRSSDAG